jgi:hypothetical protein
LVVAVDRDEKLHTIWAYDSHKDLPILWVLLLLLDVSAVSSLDVSAVRG